MNEEDLLKIINDILEDEGEELRSSLDPNLDLRDDLGFDSITLAQLTVKIESLYNVDIFEDGLIRNIQEIYDKVNRR